MVRTSFPTPGALAINVPLGITEEQIIETLGRVGQVLNFRLVYDKETGRPKGFGFAEFADGDAAASAVRNLNDYEIMGRKLRVDWSNDNGSGDSAPTTYAPPVPMNGQPQSAPVQQSRALPELPGGTDPPPNLTATDAISRTLDTLPPPQLLDILSQMKGLVMTDPAKATELLRKAPQLAYALFQALLLLNLVEPNMLTQIVEQSSGPPPSAVPPRQAPPVAVQPQHNYAQYAPQPTPTPAMHAPPPQPYAQPPTAIPPQIAQLPPEQQQQYLTILQLTPEQLGALDPNQRNQIMQIRQMFGIV